MRRSDAPPPSAEPVYLLFETSDASARCRIRATIAVPEPIDGEAHGAYADRVTAFVDAVQAMRDAFGRAVAASMGGGGPRGEARIETAPTEPPSSPDAVRFVVDEVRGLSDDEANACAGPLPTPPPRTV